MRVAGYIRVSTEEQAKEGYSLEAQRDKLASFCRSQDWTLVEVYVEEGKSAKDTNRPELKRMMSDAKDGHYDIILVYRLDRLTRSVMDLYELLRTFEAHDIKFKSATEIYDTTTAMGKLFITIVAALAQWERENLSERVRFGMEELVREGKWHGGPVPYGYSWDGNMLNIIPEEADVLRELRKLYMSGEGFASVSRSLNLDKNKHKRGTKWNAQSVWAALDNPIYAGKIRYGEKKKNGKYATRKKEDRVNVIWAETGFPTIFTWEEYEEHRDRMKRREFHGHSRKREYWFSGILRCARCGATLIGRPYRNKRKDGTVPEGVVNYICSTRSLGGGCNLPLLRQSIAEKLIMDRIEQIRIDHGEIANAADSRIGAEATEREHLQRELHAIAERRKKWQYMFTEDLISAEDLRARRKEEDERERQAHERLSEIRSKEISASQKAIGKMFELPDLWGVLDDGDRKELMQTIFKRIVIECEVETGKGISKRRKGLPFYVKEHEFL